MKRVVLVFPADEGDDTAGSFAAKQTRRLFIMIG